MEKLIIYMNGVNCSEKYYYRKPAKRMIDKYLIYFSLVSLLLILIKIAVEFLWI